MWLTFIFTNPFLVRYTIYHPSNNFPTLCGTILIPYTKNKLIVQESTIMQICWISGALHRVFKGAHYDWKFVLEVALLFSRN